MLLPLLMKEEMFNQDMFWAPDIDSALVGAAINSIGKELRQHRDDALSSILETKQLTISPNAEENANVVLPLKTRSHLEGMRMR